MTTIWAKTASDDAAGAELNTQVATNKTSAAADEASGKKSFSSLRGEILQGREQQEERTDDNDFKDRECVQNGEAATSEEQPNNATTKRKYRKDKVTVGRNTESSPRNSTLSRLLFSKGEKEANKRDQLKVVYRQFGPDAKSILNVEREDGMPSPEAPDHVVVKIQVRIESTNRIS